MPRWVVVSSLILGTAAIGLGIPPEAAKEKSAVPSPEADQAANRAQVEKGLRVQTWAAEPLLANPVAFAFDEHGRCFVAETFRMHDGVIDTRSYMHMLDDDIGSRTIADRLKKYQTHKLKDYSGFSEQLRIIWDSKGAGKADASAVFAGGFNKTEDGLAAGVLARKGTVYFTCIPDLYAFTTTPDSAKPTEKKSLATGFGIRDQFVGHDLHGLRMGPMASSTSPSATAASTSLIAKGSASSTPIVVLSSAAIPMAPTLRLSTSVCATRRNWLSTIRGTSSPTTTTPTRATRPAGCRSSRGATAAGAVATSMAL